jgi:hypothetical protein
MPDDEDEAFDYGSLSESEQQETLYRIIGFTGEGMYRGGDDGYAHDLFYNAFYNNDISMRNRMELMDSMNDYLWQTYGLDFEAVWDWDDFREWYAAQ